MSWTPTDITVIDWGHLRVTMDGVDVTFYRDRVTIVGGWQDTDPYSSNTADVAFPQISNLEAMPSWLAVGNRARFDHVNNGAVVANLFDGIIDAVDEGDDVVSCTLKGTFSGRNSLKLHQPPIVGKTQDIGKAIYNEADPHIVAYDMLPDGGVVTGYDTQARGDRAMTRLGFIDQLLGEAVKPNGDSLTILQDPTDRKTYVQQWRELKATPDATVDAGAHGVKVSLSRDLLDNVNRVYAEWVTPDGERCRNAVYPRLGDVSVPDYPNTDNRSIGLGDTNADTDSGSGVRVMRSALRMARLLGVAYGATGEDLGTVDDDVVDAIEELQRDSNLTVTGAMTPSLWAILFADGYEQQSFAGAHYRPVALDKRTDFFLRGPDGTPYDLNPDHDASIVPVEGFFSHGEGMRTRRVKRHGRAVIQRNEGRSGTMTLTSDPAEMSRFSLRAGMTIKARYLSGSGATGVKLYISSVQVDWASGSQSVTLAVSTKARHYMDLAARAERNRLARQDPGAQWRHQLRRSAQTSDFSGWEGESGAGIIEPTDLVAGWNVIRVIACQLGVLGDLKLRTTNTAVPFFVAAFAAEPHVGPLATMLPDPFVWVNSEDQTDVFMDNLDWLREDGRLMFQYWGTPAQPCGYFPLPHTNAAGTVTAAPITGEHEDDASFSFASESGFLYFAVYVATPTTISGRARIQRTEGI